MSHIVKQFNEISLDFLQQTSSLVGCIYINKFKIMMYFNNIAPIDMFIKKVLPYKHMIVSRDETFFLSADLDTNYINDIIGMRQIYYKLDADSIDNMWNIITALVYLADERRSQSTRLHI